MLILRKIIDADSEMYSYGCENLEIPKSVPLGWIPKEGSRFNANGRSYIVKDYPILDEVGALDHYMYKIYEEVV